MWFNYIPHWLFRVLPRNWMVSIIRLRMIYAFEKLGQTHSQAVEVVDKAINE